MFRRILVAVDGSVAARRALRAAVRLAADQRARLIALHVIDELAWELPPRDRSARRTWDAYLDALRANGRRVLKHAETVARNGDVKCETVMTDSEGKYVADAILAQARLLRADVLVLGTHGRRGMRRVLLGSDAESVLRQARIPVLVVRAQERAKRARAVARPRGRPARRGGMKIEPALRIESSQ